MKITTWNINGLRAVLKKGFEDYLNDSSPEIICLQELKLSDKVVSNYKEISNYTGELNIAQKPGYSGVGTFYKNDYFSFGSDLSGLFPINNRILVS